MKTVPAAEDPGARFRFGPLERRGLVAGWRGGQIAAVALALVADVFVLRAAPSVPGVIGAGALLCAALAASLWPMAGRTAEQWAPDAVRHLHHTQRSRANAKGSPFGSLQLLSVDAGDGGRLTAVVHDRGTGTYSAALRAAGRGFVLLGLEDKVARVGSWASVLSALALRGSAVHRVQWLARCMPDNGSALLQYTDEAAVLGPDSAPLRSYQDLMQRHGAATQNHEVLLVVTVDARRSGRAVRAAGGGDSGACTVLVREIESLRRQLVDAGIDTSSALDRAELARSTRSAFEVEAVGEGVGPTWPWPMAVDAGWSSARVDGTWSATYWVAEWPRTDVGPDFLGPLLVADVRRTLAVVMEPVDAAAAARHIEQRRTADVADAELRRRGGFLATARRRREEEVLVRRETELADGHSHYRYCGYVTVTARSPEDLEDACARTEQAAGRSGLELRRCYGDQARAFTCTLPLGRGLS